MTDAGADERSVHQSTLRGGLLSRLTAPRFDLSPRAWQAILLITVLALLARLIALDARTAHFDEGRVAFWTLRSVETGHFEYRFIIHGPFVQHVNGVLFPLLGATDFVMRLPVAIIGGLLPLSAVLFRDHLRDEEVVALALFLAFNPILLYYSRFFRSDIPLAAFMFVAFGLLVRLLATRKPRYVHAAIVFAALGFASKENAIVYLIVWIGATGLVVDTALFRPHRYESGRTRITAGYERMASFARNSPELAGRAFIRAGGHLLIAIGLFLGLTLFLYAPRAGITDGVGLWKALAEPALFPAVIDATIASLERGFDYWFGQTSDPACHEETVFAGYRCFLGLFLLTMAKFAAPVSILAVGGFLIERYGTPNPRPLVMFASYWGFVSVLGYPLGTDIWGAWIVTHAVVPLAIPAAVGFGYVLRYGKRAFAAVMAGNSDRRRDAAVAGVLVLLVLGGMVVPGVHATYLDPHTRASSSAMVQYAQPSQDMRPALDAMEEAIQDNEGVDVVFYGERYYLADESVVELPPAADPENGTGGWFSRLPLPWYTEAFGAEVESARLPGDLELLLAESPPVVIAQAGHEPDVHLLLDGEYRTYEYDLRAPVDGPDPSSSIVIFVDESRLADESGESSSSGEFSRVDDRALVDQAARTDERAAPSFEGGTQPPLADGIELLATDRIT